ncbi:MAG: 50S ribosomal protein L25 [Patescibacteria group bacterium]
MSVLKTKKREKKDNLKALRKEGYIPAVYYGRTQKSTPVSIPKKDFEKVWREAGESSVVTLEDEGNGSLDALIHDVDLDPLYNTPRHVDFYVFEEGVTIETSVPLEFVGVAPVVKDKKGILVKVLHELSVGCMPRNIPSYLEVDISSLKDFDDRILAGDIPLPEGVVLKEDPEEILAAVNKPQEEEPEEEVAEEVDFSSIEVEKKGKEEEEEQEES